MGELVYSDANHRYQNGIPYYTPDNLFVKGMGVEARFRDRVQDPLKEFNLKVMGKYNNQDGFYFTATSSLSARIHRYWELSLDAHLSSSEVYRYNNFGLNISYTLPNQMAR